LIHRWLSLPGVERPELPALRAWYDRLTARGAYREHVMLPLS
jgi:glutathione S-transferase